MADKRITETTIDAVFKSWSSRAVVSNTKTKVVRLDDFVKSCIANGLEQFSLLFERGPGVAAQRKKYAPSVYGSTSTWTASPEKWFTRVDELMTSTEAPYATFRALSADDAFPLERCRRQLCRLQTLLTDRLDGEAAYLAHKLFAADVRQATVRAKGGFKRFGAAVLHQVSFSMRARPPPPRQPTPHPTTTTPRATITTRPRDACHPSSHAHPTFTAFAPLSPSSSRVVVVLEGAHNFHPPKPASSRRSKPPRSFARLDTRRRARAPWRRSESSKNFWVRQIVPRERPSRRRARRTRRRNAKTAWRFTRVASRLETGMRARGGAR